MPRRHRARHRSALGADAGRVAGVLHVAARDDRSVRTAQGGSNAEARVRSVGASRRQERRVAKLPVIHGHRHAHSTPPLIISPRKERPLPRNGMPKYSATEAPRSANVSRMPKGTARTLLPATSAGTYSREWSVEAVVGSFP